MEFRDITCPRCEGEGTVLVEGELVGTNLVTHTSKRVSILGLAFKAGTNDIRESVSITLARTLIRRGAEIAVFDPAAMEDAKHLLGRQVSYSRTARECLKGSECAFIATGWDDFRTLRPRDFKDLMATPVVVDGRRLFDPRRFSRAGVRMATIGTGLPAEDRGESKSTKYQMEWHYTIGSERS